MIGPLTPADDFARQLSFDELAALATATIPERGAVVCSLGPNGMAAIRRDLGETRTEALMRELNLFVRRNLRGSDAVAMVSDELVPTPVSPMTATTRPTPRTMSSR